MQLSFYRLLILHFIAYEAVSTKWRSYFRQIAIKQISTISSSEKTQICLWKINYSWQGMTETKWN